MDATHGDFLAHDAAAGEPKRGDSTSPLGRKWIAVQAAADVVASLADIRPGPGPAAFTRAIEQFGGWRLNLARQGVDDIAAMLEPGLSALLAVHARGADPRAAALALWQEFDRARQPLLALARAAGDLA